VVLELRAIVGLPQRDDHDPADRLLEQQNFVGSQHAHRRQLVLTLVFLQPLTGGAAMHQDVMSVVVLRFSKEDEGVARSD
jgi:hypothetical protein